MTLPLSKTLDPSDYDQLQLELVIVDRHFTSAREQHPQRRWEYAMALRAAKNSILGGQVADVGGAGSPLTEMILDQHPDWSSVTVIDPASEDLNDRYTLARWIQCYQCMFPVVFCLSVLEHVEDLDHFLYYLSCLVAPGGLLFLTMDYCSDEGATWPEDHYHFHWMRKRIFNREQWSRVEEQFKTYQFTVLGAADWTYHGPHVFDYSFASLALVKRS